MTLQSLSAQRTPPAADITPAMLAFVRRKCNDLVRKYATCRRHHSCQSGVQNYIPTEYFIGNVFRGSISMRVWSSGYDVCLTRWRSPVRSWVPVWFHLRFLFTCRSCTQFYQGNLHRTRIIMTNSGCSENVTTIVGMRFLPLKQLLDKRICFHADFSWNMCFWWRGQPRQDCQWWKKVQSYW